MPHLWNPWSFLSYMQVFQQEVFPRTESTLLQKKKHGVESNDDVKAPQGEPIRGGAAPRAGGATGKRGTRNNNSRSNNSGGRNNNTSDGEEKHEQARVAKELDMAGVVNSYLSRHGGEVGEVEQANVYFDQAMKTRPEAAWDALLKEILQGDSKKIWHEEHIENLSADERRLILPMMKNYIEKYAPSGEFEKSKVRVLWSEAIFKTSWARLKALLQEWNPSLSWCLSLSFMTSRSSRSILPRPISILL